jgi:UTP--glucose-1-phosphate uridylyltransferase
MQTPITKAVIALAGHGTRFLPATKNTPKGMLPILDKPIIHYLIQELVDSGITDVILVTQYGQGTMEDYLDNREDIEMALEKNGKDDYLKMLREIPKMVNVAVVRQKKHLPYGNGTPVLAAKSFIGKDENFVYMFGDDLTISNEDRPITKQLMDVFSEQNADGVLAVQEVPDSEIHKYASIDYKKDAKYEYEVNELLEKLPKEEALSNMAQFGRFVFSPKVFEYAEKTKAGKDNELWLTDIQNEMAKEGEKIIAQPVNGTWYTTGDPLTFLKATLIFAMRDDEIKEELIEFIKKEIL